jgi:hypothetical protein
VWKMCLPIQSQYNCQGLSRLARVTQFARSARRGGKKGAQRQVCLSDTRKVPRLQSGYGAGDTPPHWRHHDGHSRVNDPANDRTQTTGLSTIVCIAQTILLKPVIIMIAETIVLKPPIVCAIICARRQSTSAHRRMQTCVSTCLEGSPRISASSSRNMYLPETRLALRCSNPTHLPSSKAR